jgi:hypothetical protein
MADKMIFEVGDSGARPFPWDAPPDLERRVKAAAERMKIVRHRTAVGEGDQGLLDLIYTFENDNGQEYIVRLAGNIDYRPEPTFIGPALSPYVSEWTLSFNLASDLAQGVERETGLSEQYRIFATIVEIAKDFLTRMELIDVRVNQIMIGAKSDSEESGSSDLNSKRGRIYGQYLQKSLKNLPGKWSVTIVSNDKGSAFKIIPGNWLGSNFLKTESVQESRILSFGSYLKSRLDF